MKVLLVELCSSGLALVYFASLYSDYQPLWTSANAWMKLLLILNFLSSVLPFLVSILYHLFMPHCSGERTYKMLLQADVLGVWFITSIGSIPLIISIAHCHAGIRYVMMIFYISVSMLTLWILLTYNSATHRVVGLSIQFSFRLLLHIFRLCPHSSGHPMGLQYMLMMDALAGPGALINGLKFPERVLPGKCDYIGNGHTIMHVISFLVVFTGRNAFFLDMEWINQYSCI